MLREAQIPLALWLPAALLAHLIGGGGAHHTAQIASERADIVAFARSVRADVRQSLVETEIEIIGASEEAKEPLEPTEDDAASDEESDEESDEKVEPEAPKPEPQKPEPMAAKKLPPKPKVKPPEKQEPKPKPLLPLKEQEKKKAEKKEPPKPPEKKQPPKVAKKEEKKAPKKKAEKKDTQKLELPKPDGRIAVINDPSLDKNQKDNPNAKRIADHANTVDEETMARFRSYDQNASKPTGGGNPDDADPSLENPGNASEDKRGHSIESEDPGAPRPGSEKGPPEPPDEAIARSPKGNNAPVSEQKGTKSVKGLKGRQAGKGEVMGETVNGPGGGWSISPSGGDGRKRQKGRKGRRAIKGNPYVAGVPRPGALPSKYSITAYGLLDALGKTHIRREQEKARNTRLARHRGRFKGNQFAKYRAAIENYDPSVKPGNQTSLNAAKVPFAGYINKMHNRIHPIFADGFLGSLGNLGASDRLSDMKLHNHVEMVLDGDTGKIIRAGIVKPSGVTPFDVGALSSLNSAGPFGKPPDVIVSPDGNVYLHWEFYRDPYYACTSKFARPYIVKNNKKKGDDGPKPTPPQRKGSEPKRVGKRGPLRPEKK